MPAVPHKGFGKTLGPHVSEDDARLLLPPDKRCYLYKDTTWCNRWAVTFKPYGTRSRSFSLYGEVDALGKVLNYVWTLYLRLHPHEAWPAAWIKDADAAK